MKIKYSKTTDEALRRYLAKDSDEEKEQLEHNRREKRKYQETLRRISKNKAKMAKRKEKLEKLELDSALELERQNDETDSEDELEEQQSNAGLVKIEDTKIILPKSIFKDVKKRKRQISSDQDGAVVIGESSLAIHKTLSHL